MADTGASIIQLTSFETDGDTGMRSVTDMNRMPFESRKYGEERDALRSRVLAYLETQIDQMLDGYVDVIQIENVTSL